MERGNLPEIEEWYPFRKKYPEVPAIAYKLWGREILREQLLAATPNIPPELRDLPRLERLRNIAESTVNEKNRLGLEDPVAITVGGVVYTLQEARLEIVKRAIKKFQTKNHGSA